MTKRWFCTVAVLALACTSCGDAKGLYPVSGKVTYKGENAVGASVHFRRSGADPMNEPAIMGIVKEDGTFTLVCGDRGEGVPPGDYDVLIEWRRGPNQVEGKHQTGRHAPDRFKGRYADPKRPRFHAVVKAGTNVLPSFTLTD